MKVNYSLSTKCNPNGYEIYVRFIGSKNESFRGKTGLFIEKKNWDEKSNMPKPCNRTPSVATECRHITSKLTNLATSLSDEYKRNKSHGKSWLKDIMASMKWEGDMPLLSKSSVMAAMPITDAFRMMIDEKLENHLICESSHRLNLIFYRKLERYCAMNECLVRDLDDSGIEGVMSYMKSENCRGWRKSDNYINYLSSTLSQFVNWLRKKDKGLELGAIQKQKPIAYGTPYYIDKVQRDVLYAAEMPTKELETVRDIFILQCYIGCRYSDLHSFTYSNIFGNTLSYIAKKTITHEPKTITVPIHSVAMQIIDKYRGMNGEYVIPRISTAAFNNRLKSVFASCKEVDTPVTIRDKHTGESVVTTLSKVASTHMARRTFIGCLYENGFRESDICALSGHKEGSISIQRYRKVSDTIKQSMIDSL